MDATKIAELKKFIQICDSDPSVLQSPSLRFFRDYLEKLGAKLPPSAYGKPKSPKVYEEESEMSEGEEQSGRSKHKEATGTFDSDTSDIEESDVEIDTSEIVEPDDEPHQQMGDSSIEVTEEMRDNAQIAKGRAMEAKEEGDFITAINCLTEAIVANPTSAILYANRADVYVKMKKPNAAIRDADAAIKINSDSARGYKWRGYAHAMLGHWEDAAKDLHQASKLDHDEEIASMLKKVEPNAHKIEEHHRKYQRLRKEKELKKAARSRARQQSEAKKPEPTGSQGMPGGGFNGSFPGGFPGGGMPGGFPGGGMPGGFPGGMPGMPGMPGGIDISKILSDPEMLAAFQDPEVMTALQDIMKNPANIVKHQGNPKVAPFIAKMMNKFAAGNAS